MTRPLVSIVMPCYNSAAHLTESVASVFRQNMHDWELIAVDDGSTDNTLSLLHSLSNPKIHVISQRNHGVSTARNEGLRIASGQFVAFLDSDDTWSENYLLRMTSTLASNPDAVLAYCGWQNLGLIGGRGAPFIPPDYENTSKAELLFSGCRWPIHAALTRREPLISAGGFNPKLKNAEDFDLWLRVAIDSPIVRVPEVLAFYHFHGQAQASANAARAAFDHWKAQMHYLESHPSLIETLGENRVRDLTDGELLKRGYATYWKRDIKAARQIFRAIMKRRYGRPKDWLYMLPALLPETLHRTLIRAFERTSE